MVVLIAPELEFKDEMTILHQLFDAGLDYYHLRKPAKDYDALVGYLNKIHPMYHDRIVVHQCHRLINVFNLKGIHFPEQLRKDTIDQPSRYFRNLELYGKTISSSFHEIEDVVACDFEFDYHLLSPIYSSLSKVGYEGRGFDVNSIDKMIIGMGGATSANINDFIALGYKGIGVLSGIWNSVSPVESFKAIKSHFE